MKIISENHTIISKVRVAGVTLIRRYDSCTGEVIWINFKNNWRIDDPQEIIRLEGEYAAASEQLTEQYSDMPDLWTKRRALRELELRSKVGVQEVRHTGGLPRWFLRAFGKSR